jgi:hypothetical protein
VENGLSINKTVRECFILRAIREVWVVYKKLSPSNVFSRIIYNSLPVIFVSQCSVSNVKIGNHIASNSLVSVPLAQCFRQT